MQWHGGVNILAVGHFSSWVTIYYSINGLPVDRSIAQQLIAMIQSGGLNNISQGNFTFAFNISVDGYALYRADQLGYNEFVYLSG